MDNLKLIAERRNIIRKHVKLVRRDGKIPAIIYGQGMDPIPISLDYRTTSRALYGLSQSRLIDVEIDGKSYTTLIRERQHEVIKATLLHIDFMVVSLTEKVSSNVTIVLEGVAPAIEELGGILVSGIERLEVEALPQDLPERITIDVSGLFEFGSAIYVRDIQPPPGVEILGNPDEMICVMTAPAIEEIEEVVEEIDELELDLDAEPDVIVKGKVEEGEEEGEAE